MLMPRWLRVVALSTIVSVPSASWANHGDGHPAAPTASASAASPRSSRQQQRAAARRQVARLGRTRAVRGMRRIGTSAAERLRGNGQSQSGDDVFEQSTPENAARSPQAEGGIPTGPMFDNTDGQSMMIVRPQFLTYWSNKLHAHRLGIWKLVASDLGPIKRSNNFRPDPTLVRAGFFSPDNDVYRSPVQMPAAMRLASHAVRMRTSTRYRQRIAERGQAVLRAQIESGRTLTPPGAGEMVEIRMALPQTPAEHAAGEFSYVSTNMHLPEAMPAAERALWIEAARNGVTMTRGHVTSSGERTDSEANNQATFLFSNMMAQLAENNAGAWNHFEQMLRYYARGGKKVLQVAGGQYSATPPRIGFGDRWVAVPDATIKFALVLDANQSPKDATSKTPLITQRVSNIPGQVNAHDRTQDTLIGSEEGSRMLGIDQPFPNMNQDVYNAQKSVPYDSSKLPADEAFFQSHQGGGGNGGNHGGNGHSRR